MFDDSFEGINSAGAGRKRPVAIERAYIRLPVPKPIYSGHGSLFQFHESFTRQAAEFLVSESAAAPF